MIEDTKKDASVRMDKSIEALENALRKIRTGRAHVSLLDHISLSYYGADTPLNQVASVGVQDARTLSVNPFESNMIPEVEKAIMNAGLGLNPVTSGGTIRVPLPALTEERRKDMIKVVRNEAENARVAIRNIRRDANSTLKELEKEKEISKDDEHRGEEDVQKITNSKVAEVDKLLAVKEKELMEI